MTMPQTRHYEMKDSGVEWIGEIPIGWKVIRNKALFGEVNERCGASPNLTLLSVSEYYGVAPRAEKIAEDEMLTRAESLEGYKICHKNDIVMNIMLAWKRSQGVSQYDGIVSPAYCVFRRKDDAPIDMRYIHYLIRTDRYADEYKCHSTGIIDSRLRLYPDKFLALESHVPPLSEQAAIAAYLDEKCTTIDAIITEAKASIEEYRSWKASVIFETVTKGLNPNAEMKDSGVEWIGEIPSHWDTSRIKNECINLDSLREPISAENRININRLYDYYGASGVIDKIDDYNVDDTVILIGEDGANLVFRNLPLVYRASGKFWVNNHAHILKVKEKNDYGFMAYMLEAGDYTNFITGSAQPKLTQSNLMRFPIPVPPLPEQTAIAAYLDSKCAAINGVILEKEDLIRELENYKRSLIFEVVTGKRRVC